MSVDSFATIVFASSWHGPLLDENRFEVPAWARREAPRGQPIHWRALACLRGARRETNLGLLQRA
jgi:hypothetical protein